MAKVWEAIKKHEAEEAASDGQKQTRPAKSKSPAPEPPDSSRRPKRRAVATANGKGYSPTLVVYHDPGGRISEQYRALRTNLLAQCGDDAFCTLITSSRAGEGKTVTCLNLALILAERQERRTIVVDCDLRKGRTAKLLGAEKKPGVVDLLRGEATLESVVQPTVYANAFFVPAGQAEPNEIGELMARPELEEVVAGLRTGYDYVLLDTPPVSDASDAGTLGQAVGQAVMVVRMNKTHRESVDTAIRLLRAANVKVSGIVFTHSPLRRRRYFYRYY